MEEKILTALKTIVGEEYVSEGTAGTRRFLRPGWETPSLVSVRAERDEEVQKIVDFARENQTGIITANDRYLLEEDLDKEGIFLDFERMNEIEIIDGYMLMAHVQRGVTWDQLNSALKAYGMKAVAPIAANSRSVAECHTARVVGKAASKFWDYPATNLRLVLANGRRGVSISLHQRYHVHMMHLVAGRDYPQTWREFVDWFSDDEACAQYLERLRWRQGFSCPACSSQGEPYRGSRNRLLCRSCRRQVTLSSGTIFAGTRTPLTTWFAAVWYVTNQKHGVSALGLKQALGLGSYQTAWTMLHKLRRAMVRPGRDRLTRIVEVDETYIGGEEPGKRGRQTDKKAIVVVAVEVKEPGGFGRVRLRRVPNVTGESLLSFICDVVEPGSVVRTDGWRGYNKVSVNGYRHERTVLSCAGHPAHVAMPGVHRICALLKRWLLGIHQGAVSLEHLDYYLDEYTFRFNRRTSRSRGLLFYLLLEQAVVTEPVPYRSMVGGKLA